MKKTNIYIIAILVLLFSLPQAAISQNVIKGIVKGGQHGEPIPYIAVVILNGPSTQTDESGEYSIPVNADV